MRRGKIRYLALGIGFTLMLAGCGSSSSKYEGSSGQNTAYDYATDDLYMSEGKITTESSSATMREDRKLIRTADLYVETLEFDKLLVMIEERTEALGGYVQDMNVYNGSTYSYAGDTRPVRDASMTLRIPVENMDSFLTEVSDNSNIISRSEQEEDVTLNYVDLESHRDVLESEQQRLLELMEQAETMTDIITIEERLSDIRYQIESMERQLRTYDNQIEYGTIYINIEEVIELTPAETEELTIWQRMGRGFMRSLVNVGKGIREFFVLFVIALPYLVVMAAITLLVIGITFACIKKSERKKQKKEIEEKPNE